MMEYISRVMKAAKAAQRWFDQYQNYNGNDVKGKVAIGLKLRELINPTPEQVNEIIGNTCWTDCNCHNCGAPCCENTIQLGEKLDYTSHTVDICLPCLRQAVAYFELRQKQETGTT